MKGLSLIVVCLLVLAVVALFSMGTGRYPVSFADLLTWITTGKYTAWRCRCSTRHTTGYVHEKYAHQLLAAKAIIFFKVLEYKLLIL